MADLHDLAESRRKKCPLPVPSRLTLRGEVFFIRLVNLASKEYLVEAADSALFEAAAYIYQTLYEVSERAAEADKSDVRQELQELKILASRELRATLRALKLTPDERLARALMADVSEEAKDDE
jgi:hypothetical protein